MTTAEAWTKARHVFMVRGYKNDAVRDLITAEDMMLCVRPRNNRKKPLPYDTEI